MLDNSPYSKMIHEMVKYICYKVNVRYIFFALEFGMGYQIL